MSSKLALLLKKKVPVSDHDDRNNDGPPSKRQRRPAASKLGAEAKQQQGRQQQQQQQQHKSAVHRGPAAGKAAAPQNGLDEDEEDDVSQPAAAEAYSQLVGLLSTQRTALGAALKQRQLQELEGASEDEEEESDENEEEGTQGSDDEASSTESDEAAAEDGADADDAGRDSSSSGDDAADDEQQQQQQQLAVGKHQTKRSKQQQAEADTAYAPAAAAAADDQEADAAATDKAAAAERGGIGGIGAISSSNGTAAAAAAAAVVTNWDAFMSRELSEAEVSALRSGKAAWRDAAAAGEDPSEGLWKRAKWQLSGREAMPAAPASLAGYGVKERLVARWHEVHQADVERLASNAAASTSSSSSRLKPLKPGSQDFVSAQQRLLFSLCDSYADVLYAAKPYPGGPGWNPNEPDEAMDAVLLHVLNHCAKTADVIKRNNDKLKAQGPGGDVSGVPRDQGFTRPKALILLPMRNMAFAVVRRLVALAQKETRADSVQGKEKFLEQFIGDDDDEDQQQQEHEAAAAAGAKSKKGPQKPAEHRALFRGNLDDHFRLGIRITRGQIKLFADFLQSDIIVASPVALATKLAEDAAAAAERAAAGSSKGRGKGKGGQAATAAAGGAAAAGGEADFLSSIEVCVVERADVMLMQNWQHVVTVLEALNQLPKQQHGTDIMRVRLHLLASQGQLYRQTIMSSSFASPQLNAAFGSLCSSHAGKFRLVAQPTGVLGQVVPQVRQLFERFPAASSAAAADARFEFFKASIWPRLAEAGGGGLLLVVPSYFDFVRLRNFLKAQEAEYAVLSEYCSFSAVTRARALFFQRRVRLMLYTERAHFYHRYRIRGIQDILFYGLPDHAHFYSELVNLVQSGGPGGGAGAAAGGHHATITALFCQFDALALSRVVGHSRAAKMLAADSTPTFVFC